MALPVGIDIARSRKQALVAFCSRNVIHESSVMELGASTYLKEIKIRDDDAKRRCEKDKE
jgi:hypothetical protein